MQNQQYDHARMLIVLELYDACPDTNSRAQACAQSERDGSGRVETLIHALLKSLESSWPGRTPAV
jgi:hypothetical protein